MHQDIPVAPALHMRTELAARATALAHAGGDEGAGVDAGVGVYDCADASGCVCGRDCENVSLLKIGGACVVAALAG
jgi:hypothetical protein